MDQSGKQESEIRELKPYTITADDKTIARNLIESLSKLLDVKQELNKCDVKTFPFSSEKGKQLARDLCSTSIHMEIRLNILLLELLQCKKGILEEKDFTEDQFRDIHAIAPWLAHISNLHEQHMNSLMTSVSAIIKNAEGREEEVQQCFQKALMCPTHHKKATARTIDGKGIMCEDCLPKLKE